MLKTQLVNPENCQDLNTVRTQIDVIDNEIVELIGKRLSYVKRAGELKIGKTNSVQDHSRENYILAKVNQQAVESGYPVDVLHAIFKEILVQTVRYEQKYHYLP